MKGLPWTVCYEALSAGGGGVDRSITLSLRDVLSPGPFPVLGDSEGEH